MIEMFYELQLHNKTYQTRIKCTNRRVEQKIRLRNKQTCIETIFYEKEWSIETDGMLERYKKIIREYHEFKDHEHSEVHKIYEKIMRKIEIIKEKVINVFVRLWCASSSLAHSVQGRETY